MDGLAADIGGTNARFERIAVRLIVRDDAALLGAVAGCGTPCQIALTSP